METVHGKHESSVCEVSDLWLGLDILAEQPLLIEGVAGLPCNGVYGALVDLLLDCTQEQEERLTHRFLHNASERWRHKLRTALIVFKSILPQNFAEPLSFPSSP